MALCLKVLCTGLLFLVAFTIDNLIPLERMQILGQGYGLDDRGNEVDSTQRRWLAAVLVELMLCTNVLRDLMTAAYRRGWVKLGLIPYMAGV